MSSGDGYFLANIVLTGAPVKPLFILWGISLCLGRQKGDHARFGFIYLKVLMPFLAIGLTLLAASEAITYVEDYGSYYSSYSSYRELYTASVRTALTGTFFKNLANVLLILAQVEIGIGFLYCITRQRDTVQRLARFGAIGVAALLFILTIAAFGKSQATWSIYLNYRFGDDHEDSSYLDFIRNQDVSRKLSGSLYVLYWLATLPVIAFAGLVMHKIKSYPMLRSSCVLFLVSTILNFVRHTWNLAYTARWILNDAYIVPPAISIVDPILDVWPFFVLAVLLFVICIRKQLGLWTVMQPWMDGTATMAPVMQPPMYAVPMQGYNGQPMGYPQYPPQQMAYGVGPQQQQMQPPMMQQQQQQHIPREVSPLEASDSAKMPSHELAQDPK